MYGFVSIFGSSCRDPRTDRAELHFVQAGSPHFWTFRHDEITALALGKHHERAARWVARIDQWYAPALGHRRGQEGVVQGRIGQQARHLGKRPRTVTDGCSAVKFY